MYVLYIHSSCCVFHTSKLSFRCITSQENCIKAKHLARLEFCLGFTRNFTKTESLLRDLEKSFAPFSFPLLITLAHPLD